MKFNFDTDHSEIDSKPIDTIDFKYLREFYLRLSSRGIYPNQICDRKVYQSIEDYLNSNSTLTTLCCNTILNSNDENFIRNSLKLKPILLCSFSSTPTLIPTLAK
ncbi:hypothetical protein BpHYR1_051534 [Brachionus plicatilis]|uniref:Uncharacterized protein n=1 Tax=Brachionus plicatilis TaxID=10195 RepID=A0A3M7SG67_BRAPC|nr:hypothetical protein BpHYR1_051534 [Brachionus plicatilis]